MTATPVRSQLEPLMTPGEVAAAFHVDPKTITRWANAGKLTSIRTLGGHRRYDPAQVRTLLGLRVEDEPRDHRRSTREDPSWGVEIELVHGVQIISTRSAPTWREPDATYTVAGTIYDTTGFAQPYERDGRKVYQIWVQPRR